MSAQQLTNEDVREMFRETDRLIKEQAAEFDRRMKEFDRRMKESDREFRRTRRLMKEQATEYDREKKEYDRVKKERDAELARIEKETNRKIGKLTGTIGSIVEHMLGGRILEKFQALGYEVDYYTRNHFFSIKKLGIKGEIDLILHDGDVSILIEVKTTLETSDVRKHLEKIEKYRIYADARWNDPTRFIGAVAGAVVTDEAKDFAHENGMYVIVQSGEAVEIVPVPEGFHAKEW